MKAATPLLLLAPLLAGCFPGKPPTTEVDAIEALTVKNACVGSLDRWHRTYSFRAKRFGLTDTSVISVAYVEAGHMGLAAGRSIEVPDRRDFIDDSPHRVAWGDYDRSAQRFITWQCGCNFPPYDVDYPIECHE